MTTLFNSPYSFSLKSFFTLAVFIAAYVSLSMLIPVRALAQKEKKYHYYRIQLKSSGNYLDADHCSTKLGLNPGSDYAEGACQLWRLVQVGDGWSRLQLKSNGQYLDADHCTTKIALNPGSEFSEGACQLWRFVPVSDGWSKLQLKSSGLYLDADHCTTTVALNPGSDFADGACQLWRLVPEK
ncbi:MAG: RICIN domain-containing protein [Chitinophagaceae bacterium]